VLGSTVTRAIGLVMEAGRTSKTSVNNYQLTLLNNSENSRLYTRRLGNLILHHVELFQNRYVLLYQRCTAVNQERDGEA
jgi:hypothetical protein